MMSLAPALLPLLLLHLVQGHVLRQTVGDTDPDVGGPPGLGAGEEPEVPEQARRRGGAVVPGFGNPLDRITAERRPRLSQPHQGPRRRILVPVDRIGGSYLPRRRGWSDYSEMDWDFYEDMLTDSVVDSALQLMGDQ